MVEHQDKSLPVTCNVRHGAQRVESLGSADRPRNAVHPWRASDAFSALSLPKNYWHKSKVHYFLMNLDSAVNSFPDSGQNHQNE